MTTQATTSRYRRSYGHVWAPLPSGHDLEATSESARRGAARFRCGRLGAGGGTVTGSGVPDDDSLPDEVWYKCADCDGEGSVLGSVDEDDDDDDRWDEVDEDGDPVVHIPAHSAVTCGNCDGLGVIEGDVNDMDLAEALGWERVDP